MKLVDTDIFIDCFRGVSSAVLFFENNSDLVFSAVTEGELLAGKECEDNQIKENLLHFISRFEKIPVDNPLIQTAADFRRRQGLSLPDAIIAASAFHNNIPLTTRNIKDFEKVKVIKIEKPY